MIWFTADSHFFHKNVISHCNRPFDSILPMHEHMIEQWNKRVKPTEKIYVLGDFSFGSMTATYNVLSQLNGYKILIKGNHDRDANKMLKVGFQEVHENIFIYLPNGQQVFLSHFPYHPMNLYSKYENGKVVQRFPFEKIDTRYLHKRIVDDGKHWLIHGHVHQAWKQNGRQINVGVDVHDFKPVSHEQIQSLIEAGANEEIQETHQD